VVVQNSALKTVAHRNIIGSVVRHNWLGRVSYACSTDVYVIIKGAAAIKMNSLRHLCILILVLVGKDFVLLDGNARPHRAWVFYE